MAGKKDDREVQIGPGYAIDALGREIVLTQTQVEPVPPVAGEEDGTAALFDLTVSYPDDEFLTESETRVGICSGEGSEELSACCVVGAANIRARRKDYRPGRIPDLNGKDRRQRFGLSGLFDPICLGFRYSDFGFSY